MNEIVSEWSRQVAPEDSIFSPAGYFELKNCCFFGKRHETVQMKHESITNIYR